MSFSFVQKLYRPNAFAVFKKREIKFENMNL